MGGGVRSPRPSVLLPLPSSTPPTTSHQSPSPPYLLAVAPAAAASTLFVPRPAPSPSARVSHPSRRTAMSAAVPAASSSSSIGESSDAGVSSPSLESMGHNDLLIVGPGVLGRIVAEMWKQEYPGCKVHGQTATTDHHGELAEIGIIPSLKGSISGPKFPYVIFCAPPYRSEDYVGDLRVAASNWNGEGSFLFTSSTAVYNCSDNGLCSEDSPCVPIGQSPRTDVLLKAENVALEAGGCVLRLVGLYKLDRGPHVYWLSKGTLDARPDHILNLIHYEDAASLAIAIMNKRLRGRVFVGCDNEPLSREEIMYRVNRSGKFDTEFQGFTGISHDKGSDVSGSNVVCQNDLLIVGPGVLGRIVAEKWQKEHPGCKVYGQTASTNHHSELTDLGIIPSLKGSTISQKVPHVLFCAPPSGSDDYPGDVRVASSNWSGEGSFLFTSSTALYDCSGNRMCNEDCASVPIGRSPRTDVLLKVENVVLEAGGCVLRLAGLYKIDRGAHVFWLRKGTLDTRPDHIINQIHYEDAASLAIAIMKKRLRSRIFLGCDNKPLSRQEIMDAVNRSGKFESKFVGFTGNDGPLGKRMENSKTRAEIGWEPTYPSFTEFLGLSS